MREAVADFLCFGAMHSKLVVACGARETFPTVWQLYHTTAYICVYLDMSVRIIYKRS